MLKINASPIAELALKNNNNKTITIIYGRDYRNEYISMD